MARMGQDSGGGSSNFGATRSPTKTKRKVSRAQWRAYSNRSDEELVALGMNPRVIRRLRKSA